MSEVMDRPAVSHPLLRNLAPEHVDRLVESSSPVDLKAGSYLFRTGELAQHFYLIAEGKVAVELNVPGKKTVTIQTIGKGGVVGWAWLFPPYQWQFDVRIVEPTKALCLDAEGIRSFCENDHDFGYQLLKQFSVILFERLMATRFQLINVYDL